MALEAFFLPVPDGRRFCLFHAPDRGSGARDAVLFLPPLSEEMNKSRRMAALQSRALAAAGCAVLQIDLHGCGDSSDDFGDATWASWRHDVAIAADWLRGCTDAPLWLWGHRVGCLLAVQAADDLPEAANFLFWQPVASGKVFLQQFLRLRLAGDLVGSASTGVTKRLRQQLAAGEPVEVAGYAVSPALAEGLEGAELLPPRRPGRVAWLEVTGKADRAAGAGSGQRTEAWRRRGYRVRELGLPGPAFWQTSEIEECPALLEATVQSLSGESP